MDENKLKLLACEIQEYAEDIHCASAIYAIEKKLEEKLQEKMHSDLTRLYDELDASEKEGRNNVREIRGRIDRLKEEIQRRNYRISILYEDRLSSNSARYTVDDGKLTIVLPSKKQNIIRSGLKTTPTQWSIAMSDAKKGLRKLTLHELGHILIDRLGLEEVSEDEMDVFADKMIDLRKNRPR